MAYLISHRDRRYFDGSREEYDELLRVSTPLCAKNLAFYTTETFSECGDVEHIIMGLDN